MIETGSSSPDASNLNTLRVGVSLATASKIKSLTNWEEHFFRSKTADWLNESFFKILNVCGTNTLLECGAHEASASIKFSRTPNSKAIAIEANPYTFREKTQHAEQFGVVTINSGLGSKQGEANFYVPTGNHSAGSASFLQKPNENYDSISVPVDTLDNVAQKHISTGDRIAIWIDAEGLALEVLKGGKSILNNPCCHVIKVEVENHQFWSNQALEDEIDRYLTHFSFTAILRDIEYKNQYNLIYVKNDWLGALDETIIDCWRELSHVRVKQFEGAIVRLRNYVSTLKKRLGKLQNSRFNYFVHKIASALGSKSSREFLERWKNN